MTELRELTSFLRRLEQGKIHYRLDTIRDACILVDVAVPGERWEIEFSDDGSVEIEVFKSDGKVRDRGALDELFARFSD